MSENSMISPLLICVIMSLFSYLGIFLSEWDYSHYNNLNSPLILFWGIAVVASIILIVKTKDIFFNIPMPIFLMICTLAISIVMLPCLNYPIASIISVPLANTGVIQNMAGLILAYSTYVVCKNNPHNHGILVLTTTIALLLFLIIGITTTKNDGGNIFTSWRDIYALFALPSGIIIISGFLHKEKWVKYSAVFGIFWVIFSIYMSDNKTSQILLLIYPFLVLGLWGIDKIFSNYSAVIKSILIPLSIILLTAKIVILMHIVDYKDDANIIKNFATIFDRSLLLNTYFIALSESIAPLIHGFGWGSAREIQQIYEPLMYSIYDAEKISFREGDMRSIIGGGLGATSIHNMLIDILIGIGIFGAITFLLLLYYIGKYCSNYNFVIASWIVLMGLYSLWFPVSVSTMPLFIAIGVSCALPSIYDFSEQNYHVYKIKNSILKVFLGILAISITIGSLYYTKQTIILSSSIKNQTISETLYKNNIYNQDLTNNLISQGFFRSMLNSGLSKMIDGKPVPEKNLLAFIQTMDLYKKKSEEGNTIMTIELLGSLNVIMMQGSDKPMVQKARERYYSIWEPTIKTAVQRAKYRFDLWKPYFEFLYQVQQWQAMGNMAQWILENGNPNDPTAYFFRGIAYQQLGDVATGNADINTALSHGITAIIFNAPDYIKK